MKIVKIKQALKGFTLIEVLVSILILSIATVTIIAYGADGLAMSMKTERMAKSVLLAEREMEKIKNTLYKSFDTDFTVWPSNPGNNYFISRTLTPVSSTLKIIGVSVGYDVDKDGTLDTDEIIANYKTQYAKRD